LSLARRKEKTGKTKGRKCWGGGFTRRRKKSLRREVKRMGGPDRGPCLAKEADLVLSIGEVQRGDFRKETS